MSKLEVDAITEQSGSTLTTGGGAGKTVVVDATTVTLGRCGGTVALASGASQTGFGRTGTVDWQTTKKTSDFTAVNGEGYFVDTGGGAVVATLPASPSAGNIVYIKDYDGNFATANCTVARNGSNIRGAADNFSLTVNNSGAVFIYVDATEGWQVFPDGSNSDVSATFICASVSGSGNTLTTVAGTDFKLATFTGPGTFTVNSVSTNVNNNDADFVVVAGGGGGGSGISGGGGAGGYLFSKGTATGCYSAGPGPLGRCAVTLTAQAYPITVGAGGPGEPGPTSNTLPPARSSDKGSPSTALGLTATGGGFGGNGQTGGGANSAGGPGGSGGGGGYYSGPVVGSGNTPPVNPPQGNNGGVADSNPSNWPDTGGGGGASAAGAPGNVCAAGAGGAGLANSITGSSVSRAGGGGGSNYGPTGRPAGAGGAGGGGAGGLTFSPTSATSGTVNTGGGGGGGGEAPNPSPSPTSNNSGPGGNGGSGIVMIRYKFK